MHGAPALPGGFERFPYADPDARPGGRITIGLQGSFDGLNPYTIKGLSAAQPVASLVVESLMRRSLDEPFTLYPLLAEAIAVTRDRSVVTFRLDPRARFSDGRPVTAEDVRFSLELLRDRGRPNHREYYAKVRSMEIVGERIIRFDLGDGGDRELPLILGLMPILPKHATDPVAFEETGYAPLLGSGPYTIADVRPGATISFHRRSDWWGADLPVNRKTYNLQEIRYEYYRDATSLFEAFKAGLIDLRFETDPTRWLTGYDVPLIERGGARREAVPDPGPFGMTGFAFNTRRAIFADIRVREALSLMLDVGWMNSRLFAGLYRRTQSYFEGSELSAIGRPASAAERNLLAPFPDAVRSTVWEGESPLEGDGTGRDRSSARRALELLAAAGYLKNGRAANPATGAPLSFEILTATREQERIALIYAASLARIGIAARIRQTDPIAYERRRQRFDFEMVIASWPTSLSPGNEQSFRWSAAAADREGSLNLPGVKSAAADAAVASLVAAGSREELIDAARALDRVLLSGFYVAPLYHAPDLWLAYSSALRRPPSVPKLGIPIELWWRASQ